jgi:hypothetical protein
LFEMEHNVLLLGLLLGLSGLLPADEIGEGEWRVELRHALRERTVRLDLDRVPIDEALEGIGRQAGIDVVLDPAAFSANARPEPISLVLGPIPAGEAIAAVAFLAGLETDLRCGAVVASTNRRLERIPLDWKPSPRLTPTARWTHVLEARAGIDPSRGLAPADAIETVHSIRIEIDPGLRPGSTLFGARRMNLGQTLTLWAALLDARLDVGPDRVRLIPE